MQDLYEVVYLKSGANRQSAKDLEMIDQCQLTRRVPKYSREARLIPCGVMMSPCYKLVGVDLRKWCWVRRRGLAVISEQGNADKSSFRISC